MICFLTSSPIIPNTSLVNPANAFCAELRDCFPARCRALYICSDPENVELTEFYAAATRGSFEDAGFHFERFRILDGRNEEQAEALIRDSDLLILTGGHVPTQNRFFQRIDLRAALRDYSGIIIGISAGSMNAAELVYAQPEEPGEGVDPDYELFLPGLGLTKTMLLPHYQLVKDNYLDGLRLYEDITFRDSMGYTFYAIPDGSYLLIRDGQETLRGEAYRIRDGVRERISDQGQIVLL